MTTKREAEKCGRKGCGHPWYDHTDAESQEDDSIGDREPCAVEGCKCKDFVYKSGR